MLAHYRPPANLFGLICVLTLSIVTAAPAREWRIMNGANAYASAGNGSADSNGFLLTATTRAMSNYYYRGATLSAHQPSVSATIDAQFHSLYFAADIYSVKLPTNPWSELIFSAGWRPKLGAFDFDIGAIYFLYPGEAVNGQPADTDYWEASAKVSHKLTPATTLGAEIAHAPNYANTGAWASYALARVNVDLPATALPSGVTWSISADLGRQWAGRVSTALGSYTLPSYSHWRAGLAFAHQPLTLDLSYHQSSLSKEDCFVLTGDPGAVPGGSISLAANPRGLRSNWCGAAFIATLSYEFKYRR